MRGRSPTTRPAAPGLSLSLTRTLAAPAGGDAGAGARGAVCQHRDRQVERFSNPNLVLPADSGGDAGTGACGTLRQHRDRQLQRGRRPRRAQAGRRRRLCGHRGAPVRLRIHMRQCPCRAGERRLCTPPFDAMKLMLSAAQERNSVCHYTCTGEATRAAPVDFAGVHLGTSTMQPQQPSPSQGASADAAGPRAPGGLRHGHRHGEVHEH